MSVDEDYVARVLEQDPLPVVDSDSSKWTAVYAALGDTLPYAAPDSGPGSLFTVAWVLGITLGIIWVMRNGRTVFDQWQENVHRRANRRRHGIPDDDDRPFNVAYAAAALARKQQVGQEKKRVETVRQELPQESEWPKHGGGTGLRQRPYQSSRSVQVHSDNTRSAILQRSSVDPLGKNSVQHAEERSSPPQPTGSRMVQPYDWYDRRHSVMGTDYLEDFSEQPQLANHSSNVSRSHHKQLNLNGQEPAAAERRKHHELECADDEDRLPRKPKKSRVTVDEDVDGHDDAAWVNMPGGSQRGSLQVPKRGSKRHAGTEMDDDWEMSQDKRARKGSATHTPDAEDVIDVDMAHDLSDVEPIRGTKRDREDAESVADSTSYSTEDSHRPFARKRRTKGKEEPVQGLPSHGRKRDRSHGQSTSSDEGYDGNDALATCHRKGRRVEEQETEEDVDNVRTDASESEAEVSSDPACGGRRVGETWEVNGQSFKVGLDGRRLRHALIRQTRSKFPMPKDSAHMDAKTNVDVIVEKWLNDDEHKAAKENFELAWQDASPVSTPEKVKASTGYEESPSSGGKRLLWGGPPPSPVKGRSSMRSTSNVQNPFDLAPSNTGRRVASAHVLLNNQMESPKLRNSKSFSKWEKQDLEANSLKKMRARMEKQRVEAAATVALAKPCAPVLAPAVLTPASTPLTSTTNTLSQPPPHVVSDLAKAAIQTFDAGDSANPFAKPTSNIPATSNPVLSLQKSGNTPSGTGAQLSNISTVTTALQTPTGQIFPVAQATSKPSPAPFQFVPTSVSGSTPSSASDRPTNPKPSFSFAPSAAPSRSTTLGAAPITSTTALSFDPSKIEENKRETLKSPFSFGAGSAPSGPDKNGIPNFFAKPATQTPSVPPPHTSNTAFNFGSGSQAAQSATPAKSAFHFGANDEKSGSSSGGGSLLNRIAPTSSNTAQAPQPEPAQPSWSSPIGGGAPAPTFRNLFGKQGTHSQPQPSSQVASSQIEQQRNTSKSTLSQPGANSNSDISKSNIFGAPSSTAGSVGSAFSFSKPSGQAADAQPQPSSAFSFSKPAMPPVQIQPAFSFNFGGSSTPDTSSKVPPPSTSSSATNPFQSPSTGVQGQTVNPFNFSKQTGPTNFSGFGSKSSETEKK